MRTFRESAILMLIGLIVLVAGDNRNASADTQAITIGEFQFVVPDGWIREPPASAMRQAQVRVLAAGVDGHGLITFFRFPPGSGGNAQDNIARWRRSFREPGKLRNMRIQVQASGGNKVTRFRATGTLIGSETDLPDHTLNAIMIEGRGSTVFLRFVAPAAIANATESGFTNMIEGALAK